MLNTRQFCYRKGNILILVSQALSLNVCGSQTQACRVPPSEGSCEGIPKHGPASPCSSARPTATTHFDIFRTTAYSDNLFSSQLEQSGSDKTSSEKCSSIRVLFPGTGAKREKGSQRKKVVSVDQLMNKVSKLLFLCLTLRGLLQEVRFD